MLDGLPVEQVGLISALVLTPWALLAFVVRRILTGLLVPRVQTLDLREDRDKWQASSETWQQVATQHGMTLERLIDYAETADAALQAIQTVVQGGDHR